MKKILYITTCVLLKSAYIIAGDASNQEVEIANKLYKARLLFSKVAKIEASDKNIKEALFLPKEKEIITSLAAKAYMLGSMDSLEEKRKNIIRCAQEHEDSSSILYQCAVALEPSSESVELYKKILSNESFDIIRRLLALQKLFYHGEIPQKTTDLIVMGFLSKNELVQRQCLELYNQLKINTQKSREAAEYIKQIDELLQQKDVLDKFHEQVKKMIQS